MLFLFLGSHSLCPLSCTRIASATSPPSKHSAPKLHRFSAIEGAVTLRRGFCRLSRFEFGPRPEAKGAAQWRGRESEMETFTSNPAMFANAELFRRLQGRRVRTVLKVAHMDAGGALHGTSPDGQPVVVRQVVKSEQFSSFVEVVGIVDGDMSLRCEKCTNFGDNFDMSNFNSLCRLANGAHQEIFV